MPYFGRGSGGRLTVLREGADECDGPGDKGADREGVELPVMLRDVEHDHAVRAEGVRLLVADLRSAHTCALPQRSLGIRQPGLKLVLTQ